MKKERAVLLLSGGKDSVYAFHKASRLYNINTAIIIIPKNQASWMFHAVNAKWAVFVAKALGIKNLVVKESSGEKDKELDDLEQAIKYVKKKFKVRVIVSGGIASNYQKTRLEAVAKKYGLSLYMPSWQNDQYSYMKKLIEDGIKFIVVGIFCEGISEKYLGKIIRKKDLSDLYEASKKYGFNISFEGGEAETFAVDGPLFKQKLSVNGKKLRQNEFEWIYEITSIKFKPNK